MLWALIDAGVEPLQTGVGALELLTRTLYKPAGGLRLSVTGKGSLPAEEVLRGPKRPAWYCQTPVGPSGSPLWGPQVIGGWPLDSQVLGGSSEPPI